MATATFRPSTPRPSATSWLGSCGLVVDIDEVADLDGNPVIASPDGAVVVDAKLRLGAVDPPAPSTPTDPSRHVTFGRRRQLKTWLSRRCKSERERDARHTR